jgi:CheY-like chemotaxis protein
VVPVLVAAQSRGRVLVVEDNRVNQKVAVKLLETLGWAADVASNGREGVQMWERQPYAIVLMDCQMPEMDGYEASAVIRRHESARSSRVPIVALTANAMPGDRERSLSAGMDDFLTKPLRLQELSAALSRWAA